MQEWFEQVRADFILNFVEKDRWMSLLIGLKNTLIITLQAHAYCRAS